VIQGFEFEHEGRKFTCTVESPWTSSPDAWWWFRVSRDDNHRYAPFQAVPTDTRASVKSRIVKYYSEVLERRAAPPTTYWRRGAPQKPANGAPGAVATPAIVAPPTATA
jgi:hypothetical protein